MNLTKRTPPREILDRDVFAGLPEPLTLRRAIAEVTGQRVLVVQV